MKVKNIYIVFKTRKGSLFKEEYQESYYANFLYECENGKWIFEGLEITDGFAKRLLK